MIDRSSRLVLCKYDKTKNRGDDPNQRMSYLDKRHWMNFIICQNSKIRRGIFQVFQIVQNFGGWPERISPLTGMLPFVNTSSNNLVQKGIIMRRLILVISVLSSLAACASPGATTPWYPEDPDHDSLIVPTK